MKSLYALFKPTTSPAKTATATTTISSSRKPTSHSQNQMETHFISLIHASKTTLQLHQIHSQILLNGLSFSSQITTQLISSSSLHKSIDYSLSIFNNYHPKNVHLFNALIRGLTNNSRFFTSIYHFILMLRSDIKPDRLTFPFVLKSIANLCLKRLARALHGMILKCGFEFDSFVRMYMVDAYAKVEELRFALKLFDESPQRFDNDSTLLWNVLINGCCKVGDMEKALELFEAMPERNTASWNGLINGFLRTGNLDRASELFDRMPEKNVVSWTTMVSGLSQNGGHEKALTMFFRMLEEGVKPNEFTIVSSLYASAKIGALEAGLRIHKYLKDKGFLLNQAIGTALVDMHAKCGNIESASQVFREIKDKDIRTWSVMIWAWAIHGRFEEAIQCFKQMMRAGIRPDEVVFLAILTACTHAGKVNLGFNFFYSMKLDYSIEPSIKHYALIVDLLGRAGQLNRALKFIKSMPITPDFVIWGALFCACRAHKNIKLVELASQKLLELEPKHPGGYVFLSNAYAAVGRWDDVERVRVLMQSKGIEKDPGWSYLEAEGRVHSFVAGDRAHKDAKDIYLKLEEIVRGAKEQGYMPGIEWVLHNIEEEEKEDALGSHSEKLALAYGLIRTSPDITIRIVKNLRVCGDCHSLIKYASKMTGREIVLRDIKRFHLFKDGVCSCRDYW